MATGIYVATAGAVARQTQIDITANNLANANTTGYRSQNIAFKEVLQDKIKAPNRHMVAVGNSQVSTTRGPLHQTGNPLDLAMRDEGFFVAQDAQGTKVLLRSLSAVMDSDGSLKDHAGRTLGTALGNTRLDPRLPVSIGDRGEIIQDGRVVSKLLTTNVVNARGLAPAGGGAYTPTEMSGPVYAVNARVVSGALEQSNVNPVQSMVQMVQLERDFQSITRVIHAYREADEGLLEAANR